MLIERMALAAAFLRLVVSAAEAQPGTFSKEPREALTAEWKGGRFEDGRPRVPASVLERMKQVTPEEAWRVLRKAGSTRSECREGPRDYAGTDARAKRPSPSMA